MVRPSLALPWVYNGHAMNNSLLSLAIALAISQGEPAVRAAFTPPQAWVQSVCKKTGASVTQAIEERDEAAQAWTNFVMDLAAVPHDDLDWNPEAGMQTGINAAGQLNFNVIQIAIPILQVFGKATLTRMLTPPHSAVVAICNKTGADVDEVMRSRTAAVEELVEFVESLVNRGFIDTD